MRLNFRNSALAISVLLWLAVPLELSAQHTVRYKLIELTLGGPVSHESTNGDGGRLLNNAGVVSSGAETTLPDPFAPDFCYEEDCLLAHAFRWHNGVMTDLGSLADGFTSYATSLNDRGWSIGASQTGIIDPLIGFPQFRATLWIGRRIINLGVLPGGSESIGNTINNGGQAVGISDNGVADPFSLVGINQVRTFLWEEGELRDIGTLGGPDAVAGPGCNNQRPGVIVGASYTTSIPNPETGIPTLAPYLWDKGKMTDLGTLGGSVGFGQCANNRLQVIGTSSLATHPAACSTGEAGCHAYLWQGGTMKDLGTLGGDNSEAIWINDAGEIAGSADLPGDELQHAVRWKDGRILDLGTVSGDACSRGRAINARGQIVGGSSDCRNILHAFLWEEGGPMIDLNTVIPPGSGLQLTSAFNINDRGEILAKSDLGHVVLLVPCEENRGDCVNILASASGAEPAVSAPARTHVRQPRTMRDAMRTWRERLKPRTE
jgi:probable HAF family extracellular repeat protein